MNADIIEFIPRSSHDREQTGFPATAFRSAAHVLATERVGTASRVYVEPESRETKMPKMLTSIRSLARTHTRTAISVLVKIMRSEDATPAARVSAANAILDRGWGKATQPLENSGDGALELIHRIELRADFQHLRRWRRSVEQAQSYTFKAVITVIVTGFVGAVWLGIKATLGK